MLELLDRGVLDYARVSYVLYDDKGDISDLTSAEIYAFSETEGTECYLDKITSEACDEESCLQSAAGPWDEASAHYSPNGGSNIYYVQCSKIVFSTFLSDETLSLDMLEKIAAKAG